MSIKVLLVAAAAVAAAAAAAAVVKVSPAVAAVAAATAAAAAAVNAARPTHCDAPKSQLSNKPSSTNVDAPPAVTNAHTASWSSLAFHH